MRRHASIRFSSLAAALALTTVGIAHAQTMTAPAPVMPAQPAAPSIRANDQVHEVPASMEGLQADVARLNEKFGK